MQFISYNQELATANLLFKRLFSNIWIIRSNGERVKVTCALDQRSRIFKNLENKGKDGVYKLPFIGITRTGISKNTERLANLNNEVKYSPSSKNRSYDLYTPVPIDITYQVTIVTKFPGDVDRILSNFIPFFNKDLFVQAQHPKFDNITLMSQVVMEDSISEERPDELDPTQDDFQVVTCNFLFKTYIFCGNYKAGETRQKMISYVSTYVSTGISTEISTGISTGISTEISTYYDPEQSSVVSTEISTEVSTEISTEISAEVSAEVSSEVSTVIDVIYDGFTPMIQKIDLGFYGVPNGMSYDEYFKRVDAGDILPDYDHFRLSVDQDDKMVWIV